MFVCEVDYCDFVVCTFPADSKPVLHIERKRQMLNFGQNVFASQQNFLRCAFSLNYWGDGTQDHVFLGNHRVTISLMVIQKLKPQVSQSQVNPRSTVTVNSLNVKEMR